MPNQEPLVFSSADFRSAMRNVPGAVSIVTTGQRPGRHGLTLTAGCSLSTEPSRVLVCVNKSAGAHDTIEQGAAFCWNILAAEHASLAKSFAGQDGSKGDMRFADGLWRELATGSPVLADAICAFDCRVCDSYDAGSHTIFIGEVVAQATSADREPLVYVQGEFTVPRR
ncbi:flavin reductase [Bradyrhizobium sp. U87765 SZCCT0131]|uniref:flavin reductase family protein n=1 Tax=unclassified Bradyrhizobium TaxID=2631580 RepID=UPI001BA51C64|nr:MULTISPECIES: flavin reductase family protein [unclassified Bradyrhizobium]MBR1217880.1 flavin reductase [Bradyrhizobium sp. U87765 SZCCT0131]MBR1261174.1 flavin reductase [Bradyrhizobium sp. U87765 SZCCT0134]MBR1303378.1 flavin reductase [Bradyrhizobium sp. U87765 SZCCT0110]MBR1318984.1 flavin reductase [Bradyrhizobium sp. U87765 SZCCT0109]MBR1347309.1 flavin reductase [Bradyrhizobium sp. U87765 SZCCT0048]